MVFVGENVYVKVAQKLFGQVWGNSGKNPSHPPKFACYYNYVFTQGDQFQTLLSIITSKSFTHGSAQYPHLFGV